MDLMATQNLDTEGQYFSSVLVSTNEFKFSADEKCELIINQGTTLESNFAAITGGALYWDQK